MFKKKCSNCKKKVDKKFVYCPWCGANLKSPKDVREEYGMLGNDDNAKEQSGDVQMPFGLGGIFNSLMKQLEKEMLNSGGDVNIKPKGFQIQIFKGTPGASNSDQSKENVKKTSSIENFNEKITEEEIKRRSKLKQVLAESNIRRLPEGLIYEISAPGVKDKKDITLTKLEQSLELKAYSEDKCYVKKLPIKVEILGMAIKNGKIFLRLQG